MRDEPPARPAPPGRRRCPICGRPATAEMTPFCSRRCADVDLHRWLGGGYRLPGEAEADARDGSDPDAE